MAEITINATKRTEFGKGASRRDRRAGNVPAVIYGHGEAPQHVALPLRELGAALKSANVLLDVVVDGKTGRLVPFGDVEAFRSAITEVTEDAKTYHTMSQAALEEAGQYSWSVVSRRFEKLYEV